MLKTPRTNPDHHTIGQLFKSNDGIVWYCDSADTNGYWLTNIKELNQRRYIDPGQIKTEYHLIYELYPSYLMCALGHVPLQEASTPAEITWSDYWPDEEDDSLEDDFLEWLEAESVDWDDLFKEE